ncbi:MAG: DMT family transporter [Pyramidobacter sp.]|jgi:drug/metabolite transporter (DMT)-like permease
MKRTSVLYAALGGGVMMLSASGIFSKLAAAPPAIIAFYRLFITAAVLSPLAILSPVRRAEIFHAGRRNFLLCTAAGFFLATHYVMWISSIGFTSVSSATVLAALQPVFNMLWGRLLLNERVSRRSVLGCAIAIAGTLVIGGGDFRISKEALGGDALALLSGAVISLYFLSGQMARRKMGALAYSFLSYWAGAVFLALYALFNENAFTGYGSATWACFFALALVSTIGGQMVFNVLLRWLSATTVTTGILGEPLGTCVLAMVFLGEKLTPQLAAGMAVIGAGLALFFTDKSRAAD